MNQLFLIVCPVVRMKRANSLNVLNVGARETQDGAQVRTELLLLHFSQVETSRLDWE